MSAGNPASVGRDADYIAKHIVVRGRGHRPSQDNAEITRQSR